MVDIVLEVIFEPFGFRFQIIETIGYATLSHVADGKGIKNPLKEWLQFMD